MSRRGRDGGEEPPHVKADSKRARRSDTAPTEQQQQVDMRQAHLDIARRRAAHFANYAVEEEELAAAGETANPHVGGTKARELGAFATAAALVNAREAAQLTRQKKLQVRSAAAAPAVLFDWTPARDVSLGPRPTSNVRPLFDLALDLVVEHAEDVESLWGLPEVVKTRVAAAVCRNRRLSPDVARLFVAHAPAELVLPDCASLDPAVLEEVLLEAVGPALERLELCMCGRGFTDGTAHALAQAGRRLSGLHRLCLAGAYRLSDVGLAALLPALPGLASLALPQCSRLEGGAIEALPRLAPQLRELDLTECAGLAGSTLLTAIGGLPLLEELRLDGVVEASDDLLRALVPGTPLQRLSLALCPVTDAGVVALAELLGPGLRELRLDDCTKVGPPALTALAKCCPQLQTLSLRRCVKLTDAAVAEVAEQGQLRELSLNSCRQLKGGCLAVLARCCHQTLERLDVSWCREITEAQLGCLVDACPLLTRLELWGCTHITERFLHGHGNDALVVVGRGEQLRPVPAGAICI